MPITKSSAKLISKIQLTQTVYELKYQTESSNPRFIAGQYLSLKFGEKQRRPYSIVAIDGNVITLLIDVKPNGDASKYFLASNINDIVEILLPMGDFILQTSQAPMLLVASGTGIAPMIPMYNQILKRAGSFLHDAYLVWGIRYLADDYLDKYISPNSNIIRCISKPEQELPLNYHTGRVTTILPTLNLPRDIKEYECYLCGSKDMIVDTTTLLQTLGCTKIYSERY